MNTQKVNVLDLHLGAVGPSTRGKVLLTEQVANFCRDASGTKQKVQQYSNVSTDSRQHPRL